MMKILISHWFLQCKINSEDLLFGSKKISQTSGKRDLIKVQFRFIATINELNEIARNWEASFFLASLPKGRLIQKMIDGLPFDFNEIIFNELQFSHDQIELATKVRQSQRLLARNYSIAYGLSSLSD